MKMWVRIPPGGLIILEGKVGALERQPVLKTGSRVMLCGVRVFCLPLIGRVLNWLRGLFAKQIGRVKPAGGFEPHLFR